MMRALLLLLCLCSVRRVQSEERKVFSRPNNNVIGLTNATRIVGGSPTDALEYPWHVQGLGCGGTLIGSNLVLTAAHCTAAFKKSFAIWIGNSKVDQISPAGAELHAVLDFVIHPNYNPDTDEFDAMLVKFDIPSKLPPIILNTDPAIPTDNAALTVIGFGATSFEGASSSELLRTTVDAMSQTECRVRWGSQVKSSMLCALRPGNDACQGDSGGPLFDSNNRLVGLVSTGYGCADSYYPGIYIRVSSIYDWIRDAGCKLGDAPFCDNRAVTPTGSNRITIETRHDKYPTETAWKLTDESSHLYAFQPWGGGTVPESLLVQSVDVPPGKYKLTVRDFYEDGMCCKHGFGSITVKINDKIVAEGGIFEYERQYDFEVVGGQTTTTSTPTKSPTTTPTRAPTPRSSRSPTISPTPRPSRSPTLVPTPLPTNRPTNFPSEDPTPLPITSPTLLPTPLLTSLPSSFRSDNPTPSPTKSPTSRPSVEPTLRPSLPPLTTLEPTLTTSSTSVPPEISTGSVENSPTSSSPMTSSPDSTSSPVATPVQEPSSPTLSPTTLAATEQPVSTGSTQALPTSYMTVSPIDFDMTFGFLSNRRALVELDYAILTIFINRQIEWEIEESESSVAAQFVDETTTGDSVEVLVNVVGQIRSSTTIEGKELVERAFEGDALERFLQHLAIAGDSELTNIKFVKVDATDSARLKAESSSSRNEQWLLRSSLFTSGVFFFIMNL